MHRNILMLDGNKITPTFHCIANHECVLFIIMTNALQNYSNKKTDPGQMTIPSDKKDHPAHILFLPGKCYVCCYSNIVPKKYVKFL